MGSADQPDYAERARMHDRLAASTDDPAARQMHQAMAAEFRRRSRQFGDDEQVPRPRPLMELPAQPY